MRRLLTAVLTICMQAVPILVGMATDSQAAQIEAYVDANFRGRHVVFKREQPDLRGTGFDRDISSVIVSEGLWLLCSEPRYRGNCLWFAYDVRDFRAVGFNDKVRSLRPESGELFRGDWYGTPTPPSSALVLFDSQNYGGHWRAIGNSITDTSDFHPRIVAGSAVVTNTIWRLCSEQNFHGRCLVVTASVPDLQSIFALPIASIQQVQK